MAAERQAQFILDLGDLVKTRLEGFVNSRKRVQSEQESKFQRIVSEQGMNYVNQLQYKKDILSREKEKAFVSVDYINSLKDDISKLRRFARYEKIRKEYLDNYTSYQTSNITIGSLISSIEKQLEGISDPILRKELQEKLSEARIEKVNSQRQILENRVVLAKQDKSVELLDNIISEVLIAKNKAITSGDESYSSSLDVYLQGLHSQKQKIVAETKRHDFDLQSVSENIDTIGKLDMLNSAIQSSDTTSKFMISGKIYNSEQEYWIFQRDSYLSGAGDGEFQNFFNDFNTEIKERIDKLSSTNRFGSIPISTISAINQEYKNLLPREEFVLYQGKIESQRISALTYTVDKTAKGIVEEADLQGEFTKGQTSLFALQNQFGIDLSTFMTDLKYRELKQPTRYNALMEAAKFKAAQRLGISVDELDPIGNPEHKKLATEEFIKIMETPLPEQGSVLKDVEEKIVVPELEEKKTKLETEKKELEEKVTIAKKEKAGEVVPTPKSEPTPKIKSEPVSEVKPKPTQETHIVEKDETLWGISAKYLGSGTRWKELKTLKGVGFTEETARKLQIGQELIIPQK